MKRLLFCLYAIGAICLPVAAHATAPPQYVGIDLYPLFTSADDGTIAGYAIEGATGGQVAGRAGFNPYPAHAVVWNSSGLRIDLHPTQMSQFTESRAWGLDSERQVGEGIESVLVSNGFALTHAMLWSGSPASAIDLHPTNLTTSFERTSALGVKGGTQVGYGVPTSTNPTVTRPSHALLWHGSANSAVDLNPSRLGIFGSLAKGTDGIQQVGSGSISSGESHALLWSGSVASAVDLHPTLLSGLDVSHAIAVRHGQQVGDAGGSGFDGNFHAMLWNGSASSAVDLNPTNFPDVFYSYAFDTNGAQQIGYGFGNSSRALLWNGTADSAIDLNDFLPPGFYGGTPNSIDDDGTVWGTAYAADGYTHAVKWTLVPEPQSALLLTIAALLSTPCRRRAAKNRC